jgi:hypothetical protein
LPDRANWLAIMAAPFYAHPVRTTHRFPPDTRRNAPWPDCQAPRRADCRTLCHGVRDLIEQSRYIDGQNSRF